MTQQILDRHQVRIGIKQLGRHGVPQLMTANRQTGALRVKLHAFLDTPHRDGIALAATLVDQKEALRSAEAPGLQVIAESSLRVRAYVHHATLPSFTLVDV